MKTTILRQIIELENQSAEQLRQTYNKIMPKKCPVNAKKEYLKPRIAYRLQELAFGGLSEESRLKLLKLSRNINAIGQHSDLIPGTKICREWSGIIHQVEVLKDCFEYQGQKFKSLSAIAQRITGTKWNGPKFFGLKSN